MVLVDRKIEDVAVRQTLVDGLPARTAIAALETPRPLPAYTICGFLALMAKAEKPR